MNRTLEELLFDIAYILSALAQNLTAESRSAIDDLVRSLEHSDCITDYERPFIVKRAREAYQVMISGDRIGHAATILWNLYKDLDGRRPLTIS